MLDMGDFAGGMLKYLKTHPVPRLTVGGGIGKMAKLAQGAIDLHSARSRVDFALLADWTGDPRLVQANTVLDAHAMAGAPLAQAIATRARAQTLALLGRTSLAVDCVVTDRDGTILAHAGP
jgi:cobalt-precorrin-5B (C1)-methyltransferase